MKRFTLPAALVVAGFVQGLAGCAGTSSTTGQGPVLPSGSAGSPYEKSYQANFDLNRSFIGANELSMMDPHASGLASNQTLGFGANRVLTFTYQQQFDCVIQPNDDRNFNGKPADLDPLEMASPECQVGAPSTIDPTGKTVKQTDPLYVLVPFFETNKNTPAFTPALGSALKKLFGFVPDAFKIKPGVPVQCPAPKDTPASCTMHPVQTDLGPVLTVLGKLPPNTNLYVPLVNHDHVLANDDIRKGQEWWQVIVVLVEDPSVWPNAACTKGITSVAALRAAQSRKQASADVPTNFFLFFSSQTMAQDMRGMPRVHS